MPPSRKACGSRGQRIWSRMQKAYMERVTQVRQVMAEVARSPAVMLCGDFNDVPVSWALQQARDHLRDAHDVRAGAWMERGRGQCPA